MESVIYECECKCSRKQSPAILLLYSRLLGMSIKSHTFLYKSIIKKSLAVIGKAHFSFEFLF